MTDDPLGDLKGAAITLRRLADQHEAMLGLLPPGTPDFVETFAKCSAALARVTALTLEQTIQLHLKTCDAVGAPGSLSRPKLRIIESN